MKIMLRRSLQKIKRRLFKYLPALKLGLGGGLLAVVLAIGYFFVLPLAGLAGQVFKKVSFFEVLGSSPSAIRSFDGRTNILLLGTGGAGHEAEDLTDTMLLVSLPLKEEGEDQKREIVLMSIPRDIWVSSMKAKINTAYYYGEQKQPGSGGLILAKASVEEVLGIPVHYALKLDFASFVKAVDLLDGVEVDVERAFDDYKYPIAGRENDECGGDREYKCRYEHLHFDKGRVLMDGARALKYVRSRNAEGEEGTDVARNKRQRNLLLAVKTKVLKRQVLLDAKKIRSLLEIFGQGLETDVGEELEDFLKLGFKIKSLPIKTVNLAGTGENADWGLFDRPPESAYFNQWVLTPKGGDWEIVRRYVKCEVYRECG